LYTLKTKEEDNIKIDHGEVGSKEWTWMELA